MTRKTPDANDLQTRLVEKAMGDAAFRQKLVSAPRAAIEDELGVTLPDDVDIGVVEETPEKIWLVLPAAVPPAASQQLSDEELGAMAGGTLVYGGAINTQLCGQAGFARLTYITVTRYGNALTKGCF
jgi:hypothetical protein